MTAEMAPKLPGDKGGHGLAALEVRPDDRRVEGGGEVVDVAHDEHAAAGGPEALEDARLAEREGQVAVARRVGRELTGLVPEELALRGEAERDELREGLDGDVLVREGRGEHRDLGVGREA